MTGTGTGELGFGGTLRLTWVTDHLAHVLEHVEVDEASGTWTGLACPDHGLQIGGDVDNATLLRSSGQDQIADLVWEAPAEFTEEHGHLGMAALQAHLSGTSRKANVFGSSSRPCGRRPGQPTTRSSSSCRRQA